MEAEDVIDEKELEEIANRIISENSGVFKRLAEI